MAKEITEVGSSKQAPIIQLHYILLHGSTCIKKKEWSFFKTFFSGIVLNFSPIIMTFLNLPIYLYPEYEIGPLGKK